MRERTVFVSALALFLFSVAWCGLLVWLAVQGIQYVSGQLR